ncbi:ABC transporter substrate-binding protein [Heliobacterium undosum]|uniref:ABC transporter substrate-binding protein n=2 Tax=Heliomicrobium undosum TaxID=121734 RepID=A0A845L878_9FIRM|nr:ABC transporter substrate-binding protein [Heliomicrobium undosum]
MQKPALRKVIAGAMILAVTALATAGCGAQGQKKTAAKDAAAPATSAKIKLNVGYLPTPGDVLFFVAKDKGFFDQEGLDVEMFQFTNSGEGLNAIKSGKLDTGAFGTAAPQTFIAKGTPFVVIAGMQSEGHGIVAKPENVDRFRTPQGFVGQRIATVRMSTGDAVWRYGLSQAGIDWKSQVTIMELDSPAAVIEAIKKGAADAGNVWAPFSEMAEQQGLKVADWSSSYMPGHVCCRVVAMDETLKAKRDAFVRFDKALIRAYDFYTRNQDETVNILANYVKIDKELLEKSTYSGHIHSIPDPDKKRFTAFWEAMKQDGYIQSDLDISRFIEPAIYKEALEQLRAAEPGNATYSRLEAEYKVNNL